MASDSERRQIAHYWKRIQELEAERDTARQALAEAVGALKEGKEVARIVRKLERDKPLTMGDFKALKSASEAIDATLSRLTQAPGTGGGTDGV